MKTIKNFVKKIYRFCFPSGHIIYLKELEKQLTDMKSVLDLGCGRVSPLKDIKKNFFSVGVDLFSEYIEKSKEQRIHNEYRLINVLEIDKVFPKKSFDAVIALDLIEHLNKEEGGLLIKKMEKLAKKKVIIFTPNGFVEQKVKSEPFQEHKSGWSYREMKELGYKCIGINGIKFIPRERGNIILKPKKFWKIVSDISQKFVYRVPRFAFQIFCIKKDLS